MKRTLMALAAAGAMAVAGVGGAFAEQPAGLEPNPNTNAFRSGNCVAYFSAQWQHNGLVVRGQDRQQEIKALQASCNDAGGPSDEE